MKKLITEPVRDIALKISVNESSNDIYSQIRPLITKLGLSADIDRQRTEIIPGQVQGENQLYKLYLRRKSVINEDVISRLNRNKAFFNQIMWDSVSIILQLWYPYTAQEQTTENLTPITTPSAPL